MFRLTRITTLAGAGLACGLFAGLARGDDPLLDIDSCRSGYVLPIARWAKPSNTPAYVGYYVGGGAPCLGDPRCLTEGTWGWDYSGCLFSRRVMLHWFHGRRYQGGIGSYATDGPPCNPLKHCGESSDCCK
jgi:hypothetical protein